MRVWDVPVYRLCRQHLLGEHRELHALWTVITKEKRGYARHPETERWRGKLAALYQRHEDLVIEMGRRGYRHESPLDARLATGRAVQTDFVDSIDRQYALLRAKGCACLIPDGTSQASSSGN